MRERYPMGNQPPNDLPSFHPTETESIHEIPARFLVRGLLSLRKDGAWCYEGEEIEHPGVRRFLIQQLQRTQEGEYWVVNGPQRVFVEVEDAPYVIQMLRLEDGQLIAQLSDYSNETLDPSTFSICPEGILYARVKPGQAGAAQGERHRARFSREAAYQLEPVLAEAGDGSPAIALNDNLYPIHTEPTTQA